MKYIDLTHLFKKRMPVYPGDPKAELVQTASFDKEGYYDSKITTGMHVGTHMDAPLHMLQAGKRLSEYDPNHFFGKGHLLDARGKEKIDIDLLVGSKISAGDIVFVMSGMYEQFGNSEYYKKFPEVTGDFAQKMVELKIKIIGLDTPSPDSPPFTIHKLLLSNDILIIENLNNLKELMGHQNFEIIALPAKFEAEGAPVRVVAKIT